MRAIGRLCIGTIQRTEALGVVTLGLLLLLALARPTLAQQQEPAPAEPEAAPQAAESAEQEDPPKPAGSVFEKAAADPNNRRYSQTPGDGWIPVPQTPLAVRFGGFVQLNVIHDFQNAGYPFGDFIPSLIPVPTDNVSNTEFDPRTSRITFESRTDTGVGGSVVAMVSMDFAGNGNSRTVQPRLRQAYVTWVGRKSKISFTAGQAWSTFLDLGVWPELFDLEGPNAMTGVRQGLVRGAYAFGASKEWVVDLAVEQPDTLVANGIGARELPDLIGRINLKKGWGHVQVAAIGRQLQGKSTTGTSEDSAFGWGLSLSGSLHVPGTRRASSLTDELGARQDKIQFQVQGGAGVGRYVFDPGSAPIPQDAVYDNATQSITPLQEFGGFVAYHHWWSDRWRSQLVYGAVRMENLTIQPPTALRRTTYVAANVMFRPFSHMDVGIEYYWGVRQNKNGSRGHANRVLFGINFGF